MRFCDVIKCKRQALGLTQAEFAKIVGVSDGTISNFELGKEVSQLIFNQIKYSLDKYCERLSKEEYLEMLVVYGALSLSYQEDVEKQRTLNYITMNASKLGIEMSKRMYD